MPNEVLLIVCLAMMVMTGFEAKRGDVNGTLLSMLATALTCFLTALVYLG